MFNGKMMTGLGSSEYELMTGWPYYRTTYKTEMVYVVGQELGLKEKNMSKSRKL